MKNTTELGTVAIFPSMSFPPLLFFAYLVKKPGVMLEACENYQKRSLRNRFYITGPNSLQSLSIPLVGGKNNNCPIQEVKISFDEKWQLEHLKTIKNAYRKSAFFDYYIDELAHILMHPGDSLWQFNWTCLQFCLRALNIDRTPALSDTYRRAYEGPDFRKAKISDFCIATEHLYTSLYQNVRGNESKPISILDLLFCMGPEGKIMLRQIETDQ